MPYDTSPEYRLLSDRVSFMRGLSGHLEPRLRHRALALNDATSWRSRTTPSGNHSIEL